MTLEQQLSDAMGELRAQVGTIVQMHDDGKTVDEIADALLDEARRKAVRHVAREMLGVEIDLPSTRIAPAPSLATCAAGFVQCDGNRPEILGNDDRIELDLGNDVRRTTVSGHVTSWQAVRGWRLVK